MHVYVGALRLTLNYISLLCICFLVAWSTVKIRSFQDIIESFGAKKKPRLIRVGVKELIQKRKKWLGCLRREDYKRFEWIIEVLGILYKPFAP